LLPRRPVGKSLGALTDELAQSDHGLIMVMGKGGVGKTTLAAALALGLLERGHKVHLSTTDPAAHLVATLEGTLDGLEISRIDPAVEVERYTTQMLNERSVGLDAEGRALLFEDLRSPCTEEVAVFHAFSRLISQARRGFVVLDTAPTGHSLLLIEATSAYHRQTMRTLGRQLDPARITTPLSRLQDASLTKVVLVTLPETTPVSQAEALQRDLKRAGIEPFAWVVNRSLSASSTRDPLLASRLENERRQLSRLDDGVARNVFVVPWFPTAPLGLDALTAMTRDARPAQVTPRTQMGATASWH
jgi:arsenite-transporting ATPase